jgi:hypothetical protein
MDESRYLCRALARSVPKTGETRMARTANPPYQWLPPYHWLEGSVATRCQHRRMEIAARAATGLAARGQVRYWCTCRACGLEVGPFKSPESASRWAEDRR